MEKSGLKSQPAAGHALAAVRTVAQAKGTFAKAPRLKMMPLFHLNLFNDVDNIDEEGEEFPDLACAKAMAISSARDLMAEHLKEGRPIDLRNRIEVADESGKVLAVIPFREVITVTGLASD